MNLMLSQMTQLPVAAEPAETPAVLPAVSAAGDMPVDIGASVEAQPAFNDALLNIINSLMGESSSAIRLWCWRT